MNEEIKLNIEANERNEAKQFRMQCLHVAAGLTFYDCGMATQYKPEEIIKCAQSFYNFVKG